MPSKKMQAAGRKAWKTRLKNMANSGSLVKVIRKGNTIVIKVKMVATKIVTPSKKTRKQVDWVAAGKKAWKTRRKNGNA